MAHSLHADAPCPWQEERAIILLVTIRTSCLYLASLTRGKIVSLSAGGTLPLAGMPLACNNNDNANSSEWFLLRAQFGLTRVQRAVSLNSEEGWVYEERALSDEVVISVSAPCQLMGLGLCGTVGAFTVDAEVAQVRPLMSAASCPARPYTLAGMRLSDVAACLFCACRLASNFLALTLASRSDVPLDMIVLYPPNGLSDSCNEESSRVHPIGQQPQQRVTVRCSGEPAQYLLELAAVSTCLRVQGHYQLCNLFDPNVEMFEEDGVTGGPARLLLG